VYDEHDLPAVVVHHDTMLAWTPEHTACLVDLLQGELDAVDGELAGFGLEARDLVDYADPRCLCGLWSRTASSVASTSDSDGTANTSRISAASYPISGSARSATSLATRASQCVLFAAAT